MRILEVIFAPGQGAFYSDDQAAVRAGAARDGMVYWGASLTPGFCAIRSPAQALGVGLVLDGGEIAWGDAMTVQYAGVGGREPPLDAAALAQRLEAELPARLIGLELTSFRSAARTLVALPTSARYGVSQALLVAVALAHGRTVAEILCEEFGFPLRARRVPIFCQCGEDRRANVDKAILRRADALPHGLINSPDLIGPAGEAFREYALWVRNRVLRLAPPGYRPQLHFDVYGGLGQAFGGDIEAIAQFLFALESDLAPLSLRIESPADFGGRSGQIAGLGAIRRRLRQLGSRVELIADEWCNTREDVEAFVDGAAADLIQLKIPDMGGLDDVLQAVHACRRGGVGVYIGGSCAETDLSARISAQIAVATQADLMLAKPGMGVDEGYAIVANEQARLLATLARRGEGDRNAAA